MVYICFSDGEVRLDKFRWFGTLETAQAECNKRNEPIERQYGDDGGYWYAIEE
jgi:hypothetical protein